jgi:hypothetical protein
LPLELLEPPPPEHPARTTATLAPMTIAAARRP